MNEQIQKFLALCQHIVDREYGTGDQRHVLSVDPNGKRYTRIVTAAVNGSSRSVYCFIDTTNGDILKSASWKTPAKGARGNILAEDEGMRRMTAYGAGYNR